MASIDPNKSLDQPRARRTGTTVTASEVKAALNTLATYAPDYAPLLQAARDIIIRLETEKHEALFRLLIDKPESAKKLLKRQAAVILTMPEKGA